MHIQKYIKLLRFIAKKGALCIYGRFYKIRLVSFFFEGGERGKLLFFVKRKKFPPQKLFRKTNKKTTGRPNTGRPVVNGR